MKRRPKGMPSESLVRLHFLKKKASWIEGNEFFLVCVVVAGAFVAGIISLVTL